MSNKQQAKQVAIWSVVINIFLSLSKFAVGTLMGSVALIADGLHSLLDMVSSVVAYFGIRVSERPADSEHQYGHEKYESLASLMIVILLFISAGWILFEAVNSLVYGSDKLHFTFWAIVVVAISIVVNELMARAKFHFGNKNSSLALLADAEHSRADSISSIAVLIGLGLTRFYPAADAWLAIAVSLYIFYEAYALSKESVDVLVDKANLEIEKEIRNIISVEKLQIEKVKTRKIGVTNLAEVFLVCNAKRKMEEVSKIIADLETRLLKEVAGLSQVSINVKSHELTTTATKTFWGGRYRSRNQHPDGVHLGPGGKCVCSKCYYTVEHQRGQSCQEIKCPHCGAVLTRKDKK
jgi:cation diffusion facilitator family transporter